MKSKKPYTWEEIKEFLVKELKRTKHIMTFGTIGSCNVERDIDIIITKKPKSGSADFYKEIHRIFDNIDSYLKKKYGVKIIKTPHISYQVEFAKLSNLDSDDLIFHVMIYNSFSILKKDWDWVMFKGESVKDVLKGYNLLLGSSKDLFSSEFQKGNYADNLFMYVSIYDRTNSNYPEKFLLEVMNDFFDYLFKKRLKIKAPMVKTKKQVREVLYQFCDEVDKLNKK